MNKVTPISKSVMLQKKIANDSLVDIYLKGKGKGAYLRQNGTCSLISDYLPNLENSEDTNLLKQFHTIHMPFTTGHDQHQIGQLNHQHSRQYPWTQMPIISNAPDPPIPHYNVFFRYTFNGTGIDYRWNRFNKHRWGKTIHSNVFLLRILM